MYVIDGKKVLFNGVKMQGGQVLCFGPPDPNYRRTTHTIHKNLYCDIINDYGLFCVRLHPLELPGIDIGKYVNGKISVRLELPSGQCCTYRIENGEWVF